MNHYAARRSANVVTAGIIVLLLGGLALWAGLQWVLVWVPTLGHLIPQGSATQLSANLDLDYLNGIGLAIVLGISIFFWPVSAEDRGALLRVWAVKCLVTLVLMLYYESYYELDCFGYFYHGAHLTEWTVMRSNGVVDNFCAGLLLFIPESFHAVKVAFSMIGMLAIFIIYRAGIRIVPQAPSTVFVALACFPSVLFFSSIIGKEPIILLAIAAYVYGSLAFYDTQSPAYLAIAAAGIYLGMAIRPWLGGIMVLPVPVLLFFPRSGQKINLGTAAMVLLAGALFMNYALSRSIARFGVSSSEELVARTEVLSRSFGTGGSSASEMGAGGGNIVWGMFTALFRPLPGEVLSPFGLMASLENVILIWLLFDCYRKLRRPVLREPLVWWAGAFVLVWTVLYGSVATGNLGATFRFKVQVMPILLGLLLYVRHQSSRPVDARQAEIEDRRPLPLRRKRPLLGGAEPTRVNRALVPGNSRRFDHTAWRN